MELHQLKYFQTVARLGHMTRAAEALYVSQPSLSRAIAQLEQELGAPLFERNGRRIHLNQYGQILLRRVDFALEDLEQARREIQDLIEPEQGVVALSVLRGSGMYLLPSLLSAFRQRYPRIRFQLQQEASDATFAGLRPLEEGEVDFCLCSSPQEAFEGIWQPILTDQLRLAVPAHHPLAQREQIHLTDVAQEPFIGLPAGAHFQTLIETLCRQAGFTPRVVIEVDELTTAYEMVAAGGGVALLPESIWRNLAHPAAVALHLAEETASWTIGLAWSENHTLSSAACLFRQYVLEVFK
jgi:DNA-binding transcriptional LysR family regulator